MAYRFRHVLSNLTCLSICSFSNLEKRNEQKPEERSHQPPNRNLNMI